MADHLHGSHRNTTSKRVKQVASPVGLGANPGGAIFVVRGRKKKVSATIKRAVRKAFARVKKKKRK